MRLGTETRWFGPYRADRALAVLPLACRFAGHGRDLSAVRRLRRVSGDQPLVGRPDSPVDERRAVVTLRPELRDSNLERAPARPEAETICWDLNPNFPPEIRANSRVQFLGTLGTVRYLSSEHVAAVSVPEPMWLRYWPRVVLVVVLTQMLRVLARRKPVRVGTYAIENLDPVARLTHPLLDRWPSVNALFARAVLLVLRITSLIVDRAAFGTTAAELNYLRSGLFSQKSRAVSRVIAEAHGPCPRCAPSEFPTERRKRVLFLGQLDHRKGVEDLLEAWGRATLASSGWELLLCGKGPLEGLVTARQAADPSVQLGHPTRADVHRLLRESWAVVLPSRRVPRWREQIGLSLLEGESHGCRLIGSDETGIASELAARSHAQIFPSGDVDALARALDRLPGLAPAEPTSIDSSGALLDFMAEDL